MQYGQFMGLCDGVVDTHRFMMQCSMAVPKKWNSARFKNRLKISEVTARSMQSICQLKAFYLH